MSLTEAIARRRHRLGFGIHSPFAYFVVENIIRNRRDYAYYAYNTILGYAGEMTGRDLHRALILHRLIARLGISTVITSRQISDIERLAINLAGNVSIIQRGEHISDQAGVHPLLAITANYGDSIPMLTEDGDVAFITGDISGARQLLHALPGGLLLEDKHSALLFRRSSMAHTHYKIKI